MYRLTAIAGCLIALMLTSVPRSLAQDFLTYLGGTANDSIDSVAVAPDGGVVFCGNTGSPGLATGGVFQPQIAGNTDVFVGKTNPGGDQLKFLTYLGGGFIDICVELTVDNHGDIVVIGLTGSEDFPTPGGFDTTLGGTFPDLDAFVAKLSGNGESLVFGTYLGGDDSSGTYHWWEQAGDVHTDAARNIYVTGQTTATDFPADTLLHGHSCGEDTPTEFGAGDVFVARLDPAGQPAFIACYGGDNRDMGMSIGTLPGGEIVVAGFSASDDFPVTPGVPDLAGAGFDATLAVLAADGQSLAAAMRFGGGQDDTGTDLIVLPDGRAAVAGLTQSTDLPVTGNAFQSQLVSPDGAGPAASNAFVTVLTADLATVDYLSYFGAGSERGMGVAADALGQLVLSAVTATHGLPASEPGQSKGPDWRALAEPVGVPADVRSIAASSIAQGEPGFVVVGVDGPNRLYWFGGPSSYFPVESPFSQVNDTRAVAIGRFDADFDDDIVVVNADAPGYVYVRGPSTTFSLRHDFGAADPLAVDVTIADITDNFDPEVVVVRDGGDGVYYSFSGSNASAAIPFGGGPRASRGIVTVGATYLVETVAPDRLLIHSVLDGQFQTTERQLPGTLLGQVRAGDVDGVPGEDLVIANDLGAALVVPFGDGSGLPWHDAPVMIGAPDRPTRSVSVVDHRGVMVSSDDGLRFFASEWAPFVLHERQFIPSTGGAMMLSAMGADAEVLAAGGGASPESFLQFEPWDLYVGGFDTDTGDLVFGRYIGGSGDESSGRVLGVDGEGRFVTGGSSSSDDLPVFNALQGQNAGNDDGFLARFAYPYDADGDGISDLRDNCVYYSNPTQTDADEDGAGNRCDADLDNDGRLNAVDIGLFKLAFLSAPGDDAWNAAADFNDDGVVNALDLGILREQFVAAAD